MAGTRYGLEDVSGYDPVQLRRYRDAIAASNGHAPSDRHFLWVELGPTRLLRRLGVRYYVAQAGQVLRRLTVVLRTPTATVEEDDKALPIARVNRPGRTDPARIVVREPDRVVIDTPAGPAGPPRARGSGLPGLEGHGRRARGAGARAARALPRRRSARGRPSRGLDVRAAQRRARPLDLARDARRRARLHRRGAPARAPRA